MRSTATAVLERMATITEPFVTEPYELPWASEARFFVQILEGSSSGLSATTEISPDGLQWCRLDDLEHPCGELTSWSVREFGQWLRVRIVPDDGVRAVVRIYLVGKS